jgi:hypothetical protein
MHSRKDRKRVLIIGDSLALPRERPEQVKYDETWPELLKTSGKFDIIQLSIGGGTIVDIFDQVSYYKNFQPDINIIQSGIVDCAPRAFTQLELKILLSNKIFRIMLSRFLPVHFLRKIRNQTYVNKSKFNSFYEKVILQFENCHHISIGITPNVKDYENKIRGIGKNREEYNTVIKRLSQKHDVSYIDTDLISEDGIMSDYHPSTATGHLWIYKSIIKSVNSTIVD